MLKPFWNKKGHLGITTAQLKGKLTDATKVTANPTLAGTEADLTGLEVGDTKYAVPQGVNVVANPVLAGTEADLTGLEIDGIKYSVYNSSDDFRVNIIGQLNSSFRIENISADKTFSEIGGARLSGKRILATFSVQQPFGMGVIIYFSDVPFVFNSDGGGYMIPFAWKYQNSIDNVSYPMLSILQLSNNDVWDYSNFSLNIPREIDVTIQFSDTSFTPGAVVFPSNYSPMQGDKLNISCQYSSGGSIVDYNTISVPTNMIYDSMNSRYSFSTNLIVSDGVSAKMMTINAEKTGTNAWTFTVSNLFTL